MMVIGMASWRSLGIAHSNLRVGGKKKTHHDLRASEASAKRMPSVAEAGHTREREEGAYLRRKRASE
jgi:hypothetical protein